MKPRILVLYYSMYGNNYLLAQGVARGVTDAGGELRLRTVPELVPATVIAADARMQQARENQRAVAVATLADLENIDGIILGSPTRFGNMCAQLRNFLDQTGALWMKGALVGKPAGVFCTTATMHGGQETTLLSMMLTLLHHGAVIVGVPYALPELTATMRGGTPYGPTAVVGPNSDQPPVETDLVIARELGRRVTQLAAKCR